jgi:hypothetical protein
MRYSGELPITWAFLWIAFEYDYAVVLHLSYWVLLFTLKYASFAAYYVGVYRLLTRSLFFITTTRVVAAVTKHSRFETAYNIMYRHRGSSNNNDPNNNTATGLPSSVCMLYKTTCRINACISVILFQIFCGKNGFPITGGSSLSLYDDRRRV